MYVHALAVGVGKVKAIGVSNYTVRHLEELLTYATITPHVLQASQKLYTKLLKSFGLLLLIFFFFLE